MYGSLIDQMVTVLIFHLWMLGAVLLFIANDFELSLLENPVYDWSKTLQHVMDVLLRYMLVNIIPLRLRVIESKTFGPLLSYRFFFGSVNENII